MVRQFLILTGVALSATAFAATPQKAEKSRIVSQMEAVTPSVKDIPRVKFDFNQRKLVGEPMRKAPAANIQWKRPAGQFWGTGFCPEIGAWYAYTPLCLRPWTEYTFENISTGISGSPIWDIEVLVNPQTGEYENVTSNEQNVTASYLQYEYCAAPRLTYGNAVPFPTLFYNHTQLDGSENTVKIAAAKNIADIFGYPMLVSSHFYSLYCLNNDEPMQGLTIVDGLDGYEGMAEGDGMLFGTNSWEYNTAATRFEKPDSPYLLNNVQWFYMSSGAVPKNIPLRCYVFTTANPAALYQMDGETFEGAELGELIAYSESFIPASSQASQGSVQFDFVERNPVTGAESQVSLEINEDIIIMVSGFDADLGNGQWVTSMLSMNFNDEGYDNLGFVGYVDENETDFSYSLLSIKDMLGVPSVSGILADVSYPWLLPYYSDQPDDYLLPNDGVTTDDVQGLEYYLNLVSTSETSEFEITYNGEEECEWLSVTDVYDQMEDDGMGGEIFSGFCGLCFSAAPNPNDENRTCVVNISIPAANYEFTLRQGSNNNAVEIVGVDEAPVYYDLAGRRVANPEKGVYIKKTAKKAEKVLF